MINPDMEDGLVGEIMKRTGPIQGKFDVSVQLQLPNEWDPNLANVNIGMSAFVETDKCNPSWIENCNSMSHIVVPSSFVASTVRNTGNLKVPLSVVPECFPDYVETRQDQLDLELQTDFNFLIFGQITGNNPENDRKNTYYTIKWLCELFKNDPRVGIILKTNHGSNCTLDKKLTENVFSQLLKEVRKGPYPKMHLLHGEMDTQDVVSLYRNQNIKALVSATRGEGFGLPILEAAACDLPVIATNWSGHLDFMNLGKFVKLENQLVDVHQSKIDNVIFVPGTKWANVSEADFKKKVTKFRESSVVPKDWALDLGKKVREKFSHDAVSKVYDVEIGGYFR
jgi:glycosyltransferase involved in cell wall biosynthesis